MTTELEENQCRKGGGERQASLCLTGHWHSPVLVVGATAGNQPVIGHG